MPRTPFSTALALLTLSLCACSALVYDFNAENFEPLVRHRRDADIEQPPFDSIPKEYDEESDDTDHTYYTMSIYSDKEHPMEDYYVNMTEWLQKPGVVGQLGHDHLNSSYRKAAAVQLKFNFPFYGHYLTNLTVATGGFCYVGDQTHSWLAATQYIAPLMANFDTMSPNSSIIYGGNDERMIIEWSQVHLRDASTPDEAFTFQLSMFKNGTLWFVYKEIPRPVSNISDNNHPRKTGISDAYLFNHKFPGTKPTTKRVIHEYHRIEVPFDKIKSNTVVVLTALPTCLALKTCDECATSSLKDFNCSWCTPKEGEEKAFCSDQLGLNRRRQEWVEGNCARNLKGAYCSASSKAPATNVSETGSPASVGSTAPTVAAEKQGATAEGSGSGTLSFFIVMLVLVSSIAAWVLYAFYNPHTTSGQLLIKYRPSQWQIPSSHVRYSANVHM
ncbi:tumor endothelial marker 3 [Aphelenchoides avenae]|nr:tumor endothelial marker 3 [Aphelenchus avenae]